MNRLISEEEKKQVISVLGNEYSGSLEFRIVSFKPYNNMKYCIDSTGSYLIRLTSISKQNHIMKPQLMSTYIDKYGYVITVYGLQVHRLVAQAFLDNYDPNLTVDHIVPDKQNNSVTNLQMLTRKENYEKYLYDPVHEADRLKARMMISLANKGNTRKKGFHMSEESKRKMSESKKGLPCPEKTKIYLSELGKGSKLVTNGEKVIRIYKGEPIPEGFKPGTIMTDARKEQLTKLHELNRGKKTEVQKASVQNRIWITNGQNEKWIDISEANAYLELGYYYGRKPRRNTCLFSDINRGSSGFGSTGIN